MKFNKIFFILIFISIHTLVHSQNNASIQPVLNAYIGLKDALVASNKDQAITSANNLIKAVTAVNTNDLDKSTNDIWVKLANDVKNSSNSIASVNEISVQRDYFITLSTNMYTLIKVAKLDVPVYYQFCPMANKGKGANWLSLENKIKNPYYGSMMLSCGKVVETL